LFPAVNADRLWQQYLALGQQIGNQEQRLLGNDDDWYFPATEAIEKDPLRARIFFAVLAEYAGNEQRRSLAHEYLVGLLDELPEGKRLVRTLYLNATRYAQADRLPAVVRYRLIDEALETGDLETASRLMNGLAEPPRGQDRFEWTLRRARVAIYTGDVPAGVTLLQQLLGAEQAADWSSKRADRLLQILFDLQTVQHHSEALELFDALLEKPLEAQQRRELLFWMAESLQALEQFDQAAYLYLKSATLTDLQAMDPWAQTARYRAAKALVEAGLLGDARRIYTSLMRATRDASRRAVLNSEIQRLRLVGTIKTEDQQ
jgi:tetratricopeptide (TPR) repeat protein